MSSPGKRKILGKPTTEKDVAKEIKKGLIAVYIYHLGELSEVYMPPNFPEVDDEVLRTVSDHVDNHSNNYDHGPQPTEMKIYYIEKDKSRDNEMEDIKGDALRIDSRTIKKKFTESTSFRYEQLLSLPAGKVTSEYLELGEGADVHTQVMAIEDDLGADMQNLQEDDIDKVAKLDILESKNQEIISIAESDMKKNEEAQQYLADLQGGIEEMKEQDKNDIDELINIKEQLDQDLESAKEDFDSLKREKPEGIVLPEHTTEKQKHQAIRQFLLNTLNRRNIEFEPILNENQELREKVYDLRERVKEKYLNNITGNEEEVNEMLLEYEELLSQHVDDFGQYDTEMNVQVEEFKKKCDDTDYEIEALMDKERDLTNLRDNLGGLTQNYQHKLASITDFQKDTIENLRDEIGKLEQETTSLKSQIDERETETSAESLAILTKKNIKDDPALEGILNDFVTAHKERKNVQDDAENVPEEWMEGHKGYAKNALSEAESQKEQSSANHRIKDILDQIHQSNEDIEKLLADLQRIERERGLNEHRNNLHQDMSEDLADIRARLEYELAQKEKLLIELGEYATGELREQIDLLLTQIQELREFLREKWSQQQAEIEDIRIQIEAHRVTLKKIISESYNLKVLIIEEEHHNDIKRNLLRNRDEYIERLRIAIGDAEKRPAVQIKKEPPKEVRYVAAKGDEIDMLIADALNNQGVDVPLTRLGGGFYLFGTKKIFAKILNGRLVVRVGGGYMVIDEFLATYTDSEKIKMNKMMKNEGVEVYEELKVYRKYREENPNAFKSSEQSTMIKSLRKPKAHERGNF
ncbi:unnamed protein product [Moneuplotes crassus]|uniref:GAR domain-containing protein n=1 Tax=Euplotes crassus TaxID=5936 RepID=A0AAD1Y5Q1_EUPCR|nr:unnamed protein product [Moneuplotes crassus]